MTVRARYARIGWLLAAVFQLLLPAFAAVVDAREEAESMLSGSRMHVEAPGSSSCPRVHPENCVVCRVLAATATTTPSTAVPAPVEREIDARIADPDRATCAARSPGDPPQRAPPA
ncbi:MAG: hypothetical protein ABI664_22060 [bacterium]